MYARTHAAFDPKRKLVAGRRQTVHGNELNTGDAYPKDKDGEDLVDEGTRRRLWVTHWANYAEDHRPTPVDNSAPAAPGEADAALGDDAWMAEDRGVTVLKDENGWYELNADWLEEPVKAHGVAAAKDKTEELRETRGVALAHVGGGVYEIAAEWAEEPEKIKGKALAEARAEELRAAGPPPADEATPVAEIAPEEAPSEADEADADKAEADES